MKRFTAFLIAAALLAACASPAAQAPTATPAPTASPTTAPTATPRPTRVATATLAPTRTPAPAATAISAADDPIAAALLQTAAADTYSVELAVTGSGAVQAAPAGAQAANILTLDGDFAGDDYQYTLSGLVAALLAADPAAGLQVIRADGVSYMRGPIPLLGAAEAAWYRLPSEQAALAAPPISVATTAQAIVGADPDFSGYTPGPAQTRAGQQCRRYTGDRAATLGLLARLAQSGLPLDADPARIDEAESSVLVCEDGYLHALELAFTGRSAGQQPAPYSYDLRLALSGFDRPATIAPPDGARDLPAPKTP